MGLLYDRYRDLIRVKTGLYDVSISNWSFWKTGIAFLLDRLDGRIRNTEYEVLIDGFLSQVHSIIRHLTAEGSGNQEEKEQSSPDIGVLQYSKKPKKGRWVFHF